MTDGMLTPRHLEDWVGLVRAEFQELPDLRLTLSEATDLWELDRADLEIILTTFVDAGYLRRSVNRGGGETKLDQDPSFR